MDLETSGFASQVEVACVKGEADSSICVYWRCGVNRQGRIDIVIPAGISGDKAVVAELVAMHYALETLNVAGNRPALSRINLVFSSAQPKKLHARKSSKDHLYPYAQFLTLKYQEAQVSVGKDTDWIKPRADLNVATLEIDGPIPLCIGLPEIGPVRITKAALDAFRTQMNNIEGAEAWRALERFIAEFDKSALRRQADEVKEIATGGSKKVTLSDRRKQLVLMEDRGAIAITHINTF